MSAMASQITSFTIVYSTVYSDADQRKHQSSASLAFVRGIHRLPVNSPHKGPVTRKMLPFDDVIMIVEHFDGHIDDDDDSLTRNPSENVVDLHAYLCLLRDHWMYQLWSTLPYSVMSAQWPVKPVVVHPKFIILCPLCCPLCCSCLADDGIVIDNLLDCDCI